MNGVSHIYRCIGSERGEGEGEEDTRVVCVSLVLSLLGLLVVKHTLHLHILCCRLCYSHVIHIDATMKFLEYPPLTRYENLYFNYDAKHIILHISLSDFSEYIETHFCQIGFLLI